MINSQLLNPATIAIIGGSSNTQKPGGKVIRNIINGGFRGAIYAVNPKENGIEGVQCFSDVQWLPETDLAILAIPAKYCPDVVDVLINDKGTRAFIILSAGFSEEGPEGAALEKQIKESVDRVGGCLIGPNCIGIITPAHQSLFTLPIPPVNPMGCDLVSSSGATAVFIIESGISKGLQFASVFSVGNAAQVGVEEVLEYFDNSFNEQTSSKIKLLYIESIKNPDKLLNHASSLIKKGCRIAAIKAGASKAGSRAASSHTGALATSDTAVEALFRKAGIVRCSGREELTTVASVFMYKEILGRNIAIITHAGGPAVMLTDALSKGGLEIPEIPASQAEEISSMLFPGASAQNPIDLLATGTADQLEKVIDYCENKLPFIDAMMVIFGSPGLVNVFDAYDVLHHKIVSCNKPIFPVLPSLITAQSEVEQFINQGHVNFPDEVMLGTALIKVLNTPKPASDNIMLDGVNILAIRKIIDDAPNGYLSPDQVQIIFKHAGIDVVTEFVSDDRNRIIQEANKMGFPVVAKVVGPIHKSDIGGVALNIKTDKHLGVEFDHLIQLPGATGVMIQPMIKGRELFIGAKYEPKFGHIILCGLGGIFVEVLGDTSSGLAPLTFNEAYSMIRSLKSYKIIKGTRGQEGINEDKFAETIVRLSSVLRYTTEIKELDLNPLLGTGERVTVVDARILVEK
jgi:acetyltransferase